jgi:hypothetical protein
MIPAQEIPRDDVLPQLAVVLDVGAMRGILQETLGTETSRNSKRGQGNSKLQVRDCQIEWAKYKPGKNCTICYRLAIYDPLTNTQGDQILYGRIFEAEGARSRFIKAQSSHLACPKFGRPLMHLPALDMVVWAFPNDRKLDGLPIIVDQDCLKDELLPEVVTARLGRDWQIIDMTHDIVHYVPEHTCTVRVHLLVQQACTGDRQSLSLYGKTYYDDEGSETYRIMRQLWDRQSRGREPLGMAQPLGYHSQYKILWQASLAGTTLLEQELGSSRFLSLLGKAAVTVARLHRSPVSCFRSIGVRDWLTKLEEIRRLLTRVRPSCQEHLEPLVDHLRSQAEQLEEQPVATLHGDLHLKNFLAHAGKVALIDLDNLCQGPPWCDVGSFIAGMVYQGLLTGVAEPVIQQMIMAFCQQYQQNVPWQMSGGTLNWYIAMALINERAFRCFTRLKAGRLDILDDLITFASQISRGVSNSALVMGPTTLWD